MNKSELVAHLADQAEVSRADAERVVDTFFDTVVQETKKGNKVSWPGFGSFSTTQRKARTGRNPQTGETVKIPASTAMKFSASSTLKQALKGGAKKSAAKKGAAKKAGAKKKGAAKKKLAAKRR